MNNIIWIRKIRSKEGLPTRHRFFTLLLSLRLISEIASFFNDFLKLWPFQQSSFRLWPNSCWPHLSAQCRLYVYTYIFSRCWWTTNKPFSFIPFKMFLFLPLLLKLWHLVCFFFSSHLDVMVVQQSTTFPFNHFLSFLFFSVSLSLSSTLIHFNAIDIFSISFCLIFFLQYIFSLTNAYPFHTHKHSGSRVIES